MEKLMAEINRTFADALTQVYPQIEALIAGKLAENESSDTGDCQMQLTLQPKIRIECNKAGEYVVKTSIPVKEIKTSVGECESVWSDGQQELDLNGNAGAPKQ